MACRGIGSAILPSGMMAQAQTELGTRHSTAMARVRTGSATPRSIAMELVRIGSVTVLFSVTGRAAPESATHFIVIEELAAGPSTGRTYQRALALSLDEPEGARRAYGGRATFFVVRCDRPAAAASPDSPPRRDRRSSAGVIFRMTSRATPSRARSP